MTTLAPRQVKPEQASRLRTWMLDGLTDSTGRHQGPHGKPAPEHKKHSWWNVMCLTGVDYFSTLGYQPGIAILAAGVLSPLATIILVIVTLCGALPVYRRIADESPRGEGSIQMLERLLPRWWGKILVLCLLGFAATDFIITMTLSAADASAHLIENPLLGSSLHGGEVWITLGLLTALGAVFLKGFKEAIGIAVVLVWVYLALNAAIVVVAVMHVLESPQQVTDWWSLLNQTGGGNPLAIIGVALLVFPKLALGLSGFETGVAVMPQIKGDPTDTPETLAGRKRGAKRLLTTAALIMSTFLIFSSFACTVLIPAAEFQPGGGANGRALAWIAHEYMGSVFGSVYDVSTICILWFAGASAMAGLLNIVPRYLPRYGMAPHWARAVRPLVLVFTTIAFIITIIFKADVDAQGGAYATGVLVLITSAAIAVTLSCRRKGQRKRAVGFGIISLVFVYTTIDNVIERPDGLKIAAIFILAIVAVSFASRTKRSFELRTTEVTFDEAALTYIAETPDPLRIIAHEPRKLGAANYRHKIDNAGFVGRAPDACCALFIEIKVKDSSEFEHAVHVRGIERHGYRILEVEAASIANSIAAVLLEIRDRTGLMPHVYFRWTEGNPVRNFAKFLLFGEGEIAPVTREVLREAEPDLTRRPWVHVA
ncbi:amino acid transporter [Micrococcales bacterium 31B]|nr:amino acid transporter [Micrococcales bacterium 31B]